MNRRLETALHAGEHRVGAVAEADLVSAAAFPVMFSENRPMLGQFTFNPHRRVVIIRDSCWRRNSGAHGLTEVIHVFRFAVQTHAPSHAMPAKLDARTFLIV